MPDDPSLKIVETRLYTATCDVAITEFGHRWRFRDAFTGFSTEVYGSVDEAFAAAQQFARARMIPLKPTTKAK